MKYSLAKILQLLYNYYIGSLCNYPTTSYNNNNNNNNNNYLDFGLIINIIVY
jgi:hypothetical protein